MQSYELPSDEHVAPFSQGEGIQGSGSVKERPLNKNGVFAPFSSLSRDFLKIGGRRHGLKCRLRSEFAIVRLAALSDVGKLSASRILKSQIQVKKEK